MQYILLDTAVAAGVVSKISPDSNIKDKGQRWLDLVRELTADIANPALKIPTPVFYEMAARGESHYNTIATLKQEVAAGTASPIFQYISHSITPDVLDIATRYRAACRNKGQKQEIDWVDAILAAYCFGARHFLITPNQKDFPDYFFEVKKIGLRPLDKQRNPREFVVLLAPRMDNWASVVGSA